MIYVGVYSTRPGGRRVALPIRRHVPFEAQHVAACVTLERYFGPQVLNAIISSLHSASHAMYEISTEVMLTGSTRWATSVEQVIDLHMSRMVTDACRCQVVAKTGCIEVTLTPRGRTGSITFSITPA